MSTPSPPLVAEQQIDAEVHKRAEMAAFAWGWDDDKRLQVSQQWINDVEFRMRLKGQLGDDETATRETAMRFLIAEEAMKALAREEGRAAARKLLDSRGVTDLGDAYVGIDQLASLPKPDPLIDGVLNRHSLIILRGRDGTLKSFTALDWALCLASGKAWQGRPTRSIRVLYIAGEGAYGIAPRVAAWRYAWSADVAPEAFVLRISAVNLYRAGPDFDDLLDRIEKGRFGLVVVDTLRRASGGADGNGTDMGVVMDNLIRIKDATADGSVLTVTHTDKGDNDTRGFSGIEDDSDIVWAAKRDGDGALELHLTKMKDGPDGTKITLRPTPVLDSLVLSGGKFTDTAAMQDTDREFLTVMTEVFATTGATITQFTDASGMARSTAYKVRGRLQKAGMITVTPEGNADLMRLTAAATIAMSTADRGIEAADTAQSTPKSTPEAQS